MWQFLLYCLLVFHAANRMHLHAGIPADDPANAIRLTYFLAKLRQKLPNKSISVALPASYWYLKPYPISYMSQYVDYFVYMTYDLHGQWDYGNAWTEPGCPGGNCLRSHINYTETVNALAMITKAGAPSNKAVVGVSSYGLSFRMTDPGCTGPMCTYTGPSSGATPGRCTQTPGYISDAEINEIIANNPNAQTFVDNSDGNVLVNGIDWISYMAPLTKYFRTLTYQDYNLGGISDWAADLESFVTPTATSNPSSTDSSGSSPTDHKHNAWRTIDCLAPAATNADAPQGGEWRWDNLNAGDAWSDVKAAWKNRDRAESLSISRFVSNYFNGPEGMNCDLMSTGNGCLSWQTCAKTRDSGAAGYLILNSFVALSAMMIPAHDSLTQAQADFTNGLPYFVSVFAPPAPDLDKANQILLDIVGIGVAGLAAPLFNNCEPSRFLVHLGFMHSSFANVLSGFEYFERHPENLDTAKDETLNFIAGAVSLAKDSATSSDESAMEILSDTSKLSQKLIDSWRAAFTNELKHLFDGDAGLPLLDEIMGKGQIVEAINPVGGSDATEPLDDDTQSQLAQAAVYEIMIPDAWRRNRRAPFVLDSGYDCGTVDPISYVYAAPDDSHKTWVCVDGKLYYLLSTGTDLAEDCGAPGAPPGTGTQLCSTNLFEAPPGIEQLTGGTDWGGLTRDNLVISAVHGYKNNGNKNGWPVPNFASTDGSSSSDLFSLLQNHNGTSSKTIANVAGMVNIPVCSGDEAQSNWKQSIITGKTANYPCNG